VPPDDLSDRDFEAPAIAAGAAALIVDIDGFEGPLDLLLDLARRQKVDLARISVLALAEQYLAFIDRARAQRLELAADYLVVAAWLAYLKSRLLLPEPPALEDEPPAALLAAALAFRLRRLEAMRNVAGQLSDRPLLGRDRFSRGAPGLPEADAAPSRPASADATLFDLLSAWCEHRARRALARVSLPSRAVWSLNDARERLERLLGHAVQWMALDSFLLAYAPPGIDRASVLASGLNASLELAREGRIDLMQAEPFAPLMLRQRSGRLDLGEADG
jgi:segregation and condensation protein A